MTCHIVAYICDSQSSDNGVQLETCIYSYVNGFCCGLCDHTHTNYILRNCNERIVIPMHTTKTQRGAEYNSPSRKSPTLVRPLVGWLILATSSSLTTEE
jgi:hypothetical protein